MQLLPTIFAQLTFTFEILQLFSVRVCLPFLHNLIYSALNIEFVSCQQLFYISEFCGEKDGKCGLIHFVNLLLSECHDELMRHFLAKQASRQAIGGTLIAFSIRKSEIKCESKKHFINNLPQFKMH